MTRHEADRVHEASGIAFTFAGHLVWGNPKLAEGLHGDVETWLCSRCRGLVVGDDATIAPHAELHLALDKLAKRLDNVVPGAFKPVEVPGAVLTDTPKPSHRDAAELRRGAERVTAWRDAAAVREVTAE